MSNLPFSMSDVDFDAAYQGKSMIDGLDFVFPSTPWDIHEVQPAVVELERAGRFGGAVLDAGCGAGENALFLAGAGHRVTGVDGSPAALDTARGRAAERGVEIEFVHDDVTSLAELGDRRFDAVLDSALYHCLDADQQRQYAAALHRVAAPGAKLSLLCFADVDAGLSMPIMISEDDLRRTIGEHWDIESIEPGWYTTTLTPDAFAGAAASLAEMGFVIDQERVQLDEQGRIRGPIWQLLATRRD